MALDNRRTPGRGGAPQDLWPKWMWIAVPVLVVVVVAGLWWAIFSPADRAAAGPTPTPTMRVIQTQPTQGPTLQSTLGVTSTTPTRQIVPLVTFTPTQEAVTTPTAEVTAEPTVGLAIGAKVKVTGTGGAGLNMRAGAGTGHARVKTLADGSVLEIIGGPKEANGYTWWQVRDESGTTGWAAAQFLAP